MKYLPDSSPPCLELTRRNLKALLAKLDDPASARMLLSPGRVGEPRIIVVAVEDEEHYSGRPPGPVYMPSTGETW